MTANIDQRKYLERYLSGPSKEKKKRKKKNILGTGMKIIDDDIDLSKMIPVDEDDIDLLTTSEDAPQIAGIIDERPLEVRMKEHLAGTKHWQLISDGNPFDETFKIESKSETNKTKTHDNNDSDYSPEKNENSEKIGTKNKRKWTIEKKEEGDNSNHSASKTNGKKEQKKIYKRSSSNSSSEKVFGRNIDKNVTRNKQQSDSDGSPPRRKTNTHLDSSPPRKRNQSDTPPRKTKYAFSNTSSERKRKNSDSDASPPRRKHSDKDKTSLSRNTCDSDSDFSPPRKQKHSDSDASPPRKGNKNNSNLSPSRKRIKKSYVKENSDSEQNKSKNISEKLKKTLDGKKAGLQQAKESKNELMTLKQREDEIFQQMDPKSLGIGASTVKRDRKTGAVRDLEKEAQKEAIEKEKENIQKEKYTRWGKGLKQTEEKHEKLENDLYEMSKPLARYADDKDLDNYLKNQEREGDPMLAYIKSKKKTDSGRCDDKPKYSGAFMPNRFGISPGYRWDGVDRSNGYEKRWFDIQNNKKALEEEAYKWGTEDM